MIRHIEIAPRTKRIMDTLAEDILAFWLDEVGPSGWYRQDDALDARIRERFGAALQAAGRGEMESWILDPRKCLALLILLDQFPRNMFRDSPEAFALDARARAVAKAALRRGFDAAIPMPGRQFFYLPLMHSESLPDQERSVRLFRLHGEGGDNLDHARAHRAVIRRFGRFPYRNGPLGRVTTEAEHAWLASGGYSAALAEVTR
jgi:uncharacterized protein (DUF924 family)